MKPTDERLRELASRWSSAQKSQTDYNEGFMDARNHCADELLSILNESPWQGSGQVLPEGWSIEVRQLGHRFGLCVFGPNDVGGFSVDRDTNHKSDIRDHIIRELHKAMNPIPPPPKEV